MTEIQDRISQAMFAANPEVEGDLMRELDKRGVGGVVRLSSESFYFRRKQSKYVPGWKAPEQGKEK